MRFGVLGPLAVWSADGGPIAVPGFKNRLLLAALLAHEGHPVSVDRLVDELWAGESLPADPTAALQTKIWQLRKTLDAAEPGGRERLTRRDDGYLLRTDPVSVDMHRFGTLTARAGATEDRRTRESLLSEALDLWRGPAFSGFEDTAFARRLATRLEDARLVAVEARADARIELGAHDATIGELHELVQRHPLRERLRALHMRALYAAGRTGEALAEYQDLRTRLAAELGLDPSPELAALHRDMLARDPVLSTTRRPLTRLPVSATELIGRDDDLDAVRDRFAANRLVTLTGPGGVGKTRLALEAANRLAPDFSDGAKLIELAALAPSSGADEVAETVIGALGIREAAPDPLERLAEALGDKRLMLILDNCEHLVDAAAATASTLLERAPGLRLLATSQEPLGIRGEAVFAVPTLRLPETTSPVAVSRSTAVALFTARAAAAAPDFALTAANAEAVAEICRRLDGIPLALELAATRVRALGVQGLVDRLDDRFRLLANGYRDAPTRQRTLRATIDWSWNLLNDAERTVLRRLAVHRDSATLGAAEAICSGNEIPPEAVLDLLTRLVDRSLVTMIDTADGPRYRLLESVADYSAARLRESGEDDPVRTRHRSHYIDLAERAAAGLHGPDQSDLLRLLDAETANFRLALEHAAAEDALRLTTALTWYWFLRGRSREAIRSLDTALAASAEPPASARAQAEAWRAGFAALAGEAIDRTHYDETAAALTRLVADVRARSRAQWFLGLALFGIGDQSTSEALIDRALQGFRELGDDWGIAAALSVRANQAHVRGDLERLARDGRRSAELFARLADDWGRLQTIEPLASLAEMSGDYEHAARLHRDGLHIAEQLGLWPDAADRLASLGSVAMLTGDHDAARDLHERAMRLAAGHHHKPAEIHAAVGLALGARREGRLDEAEERMRLVLDWETRMDFGPGIALALAELGFIAEQRGDAEAALRLHADGWNAAQRTGDVRAMALALEGLAGAHVLAGDHARAAKLLGAAHAARDSVKVPLPEAERADVDRITDAARKGLGENAFREAYGRGTSQSPVEARAA